MEGMRVADLRQHARFSSEKMAKVDLVRGEMLSAGLNCFEPGQEHASHVHAAQDKLYCVVEGTGELTIGGQTTRFGKGDLALAPANVAHGLRISWPGQSGGAGGVRATAGGQAGRACASRAR